MEEIEEDEEEIESCPGDILKPSTNIEQSEDYLTMSLRLGLMHDLRHPA